MATARLADKLARAAISQVRDGAGIDDIDIGNIVKVALREASRTHLFADGFAVGLIDFAAQRRDRKGWFIVKLICHTLLLFSRLHRYDCVMKTCKSPQA